MTFTANNCDMGQMPAVSGLAADLARRVMEQRERALVERLTMILGRIPTPEDFADGKGCWVYFQHTPDVILVFQGRAVLREEHVTDLHFMGIRWHAIDEPSPVIQA